MTENFPPQNPGINCPQDELIVEFEGKQKDFWAPATKVRQNLGIVAKNQNSTEHFVHLHADYLSPCT